MHDMPLYAGCQADRGRTGCQMALRLSPSLANDFHCAEPNLRYPDAMKVLALLELKVCRSAEHNVQ